MHTGSCLCGGIAFQVDGPLAPIQICYCSQCRKAQGTAFASNIPIDAAAFRLLRGEDLMSVYESSPGKQRIFCRCCGSPVFSRRSDKPDILRVRAGLFDGAIPTAAAFHAHTASRASWWPPPDDLPSYAEAARPA